MRASPPLADEGSTGPGARRRRDLNGRAPSPRKAGRRWREAPDEGLRQPFRKSPRRPSPQPSPRKRGEGARDGLFAPLSGEKVARSAG